MFANNICLHFQEKKDDKLYLIGLFDLQRACDKNMDCVAIPVLHKGGPAPFPDELGAHVAIRTVRRFLEKGHTSPRLVILAVADPTLFQ